MANLPASFYVAALMANSLLSLFIAIWIWRHRAAPSAPAFALIMSAVALWSLGNAAELAAATLQAKVLWNNTVYVAIACIPVLWLVFSLAYTGRSGWLSRGFLLGLFVIPALTILLAWTNPLHGLFRTGVQLQNVGSMWTLGGQRGIWFGIHTGYSYLCLASGSLLLVRLALSRGTRLYRGQVFALLIAVVAPWIGNMAYVFRLSASPHIDPIPFAFAITGVAVTLGIFRSKEAAEAAIPREIGRRHSAPVAAGSPIPAGWV